IENRFGIEKCFARLIELSACPCYPNVGNSRQMSIALKPTRREEPPEMIKRTSLCRQDSLCSALVSVDFTRPFTPPRLIYTPAVRSWLRSKGHRRSFWCRLPYLAKEASLVSVASPPVVGNVSHFTQQAFVRTSALS